MLKLFKNLEKKDFLIILFVAMSICSFAIMPNLCVELGFPKYLIVDSLKHFKTSLSTGVFAA